MSAAMHSEPSCLQLTNVSLDRGGRRVLDAVSVDIPSAAVTAIVGPNGAGKSTLLEVAAGALTPSHGRVFIAGRALDRWSKGELATKRAVLPQSSTLAFGFSVDEVIRLGRLPHLSSKRDDDRITQLALARVGLAGFGPRSYLGLSGGERQRVQLARVLAQIWEPTAHRILLLDEPTAALDLVHQHQTLRLARGLAAEGVAVAVVLHDLNLAAQYADRIAVMDRGRVEHVGAPQEVLRPSILEPIFRIHVDVMELASPQRRLVLVRDPDAAEGDHA